MGADRAPGLQVRQRGSLLWQEPQDPVVRQPDGGRRTGIASGEMLSLSHEPSAAATEHTKSRWPDEPQLDDGIPRALDRPPMIFTDIPVAPKAIGSQQTEHIEYNAVDSDTEKDKYNLTIKEIAAENAKQKEIKGKREEENSTETEDEALERMIEEKEVEGARREQEQAILTRKKKREREIEKQRQKVAYQEPSVIVAGEKPRNEERSQDLENPVLAPSRSGKPSALHISMPDTTITALPSEQLNPLERGFNMYLRTRSSRLGRG